MASELTVKNWQPWIDQETDELIRDNHGNFKGTVWFDEDPRQVDATFKTQPEVGDKKYGALVEYQTRAGKTRLKFQRADRPQEDQQSFNGNGKSQQTDEYWEDKNSAIKAQWAIGQAVQVEVAYLNYAGRKEFHWNGLEDTAKKFFAMVDRVKGSSESTHLNAGARPTELTPTEQSGYDKFKASKPTPKQLDRAEDEEIKSLLSTEHEISLDQIPF